MKKLNILYIICCLSFISQAQIQHEDFNEKALPQGWSTSATNDCSWEFGYTDNLPFTNPKTPVRLTSGSVIFNDNKCGSFKNNVLTLEAPSVDLVAKGIIQANIELSYNHQSFVNSGDFMVDVWDGNEWQNVLKVSNDSPANGSSINTTKNVIDISDHINSEFKVRFVYDDENTRTYGLAIDDYKLVNTAKNATQNLAENGFIYYPNPVNDLLNMHAIEEISSIDVFNAIGQKVLSKRPGSLATKLDMSNLANGMYILQVKAGDLNKNIKVLKK